MASGACPKPRRAAAPAAAKHDPTRLRGNTIADDDVDVVDDADGEDGGDDADAENAARKHGRWWSCHVMLCYVMIIFKINFHNNIFRNQKSEIRRDARVFIFFSFSTVRTSQSPCTT